MPSDFETGAHDDIFDLLDSPVKKMRKNKPPVEKFVVPRLNKVMLILLGDLFRCYMLDNICCTCCIYRQLTTTTAAAAAAILWPFVWHYPGEPVREETFIHSHLS